MTDTPLRQIPFRDAEGKERTLDDYGSGPVLVVNVTLKCGLTPQYERLQELVGFPCNQFLGQEPGSMEQILEFCSTTYGVTFPINDKVKVNGRNAADLYRALKQTPDGGGKAGRFGPALPLEAAPGWPRDRGRDQKSLQD